MTENDDARPSVAVDDEDAFLFLPCIIEVFTDEACAQEAVVADVSAVLVSLDQLGVRYVTAADFERRVA